MKMMDDNNNKNDNNLFGFFLCGAFHGKSNTANHNFKNTLPEAGRQVGLSKHGCELELGAATKQHQLAILHPSD